MAINPIQIAREIEERFRRYLLTTFDFPQEYAALRDQFRQALLRPDRLFRGPYLHGLAPYIRDLSVKDLIDRGILPPQVRRLPLLDPLTRPLYRHQVRAIERVCRRPQCRRLQRHRQRQNAYLPHSYPF